MHDSSNFRYSDLCRICAAELTRLVPNSDKLAFLAPNGTLCWSASKATTFDKRLLDRARATAALNGSKPQLIDSIEPLATVPVRCGHQLVGAVLVPVVPGTGESLDNAVARTSRRLRPVLERMGRQLVDGLPVKPASAATRIVDLPWLYELAAEVGSAGSDQQALELLLASAVDRIKADWGTLVIPEKDLSLRYVSHVFDSENSVRACRQTRGYLISHMQRCATPLIANRPPAAGSGWPHCKIMAFPVVPRIDKPIGMIAFAKPASESDFDVRQLFLAHHLARAVENLLCNHYDAMTGLPTCATLKDEVEKCMASHSPERLHAMVYVDLDCLRTINDTFGFDSGDDAIRRIASLLRPPFLPRDALSGRIAGDRFIVFLPSCNTTAARRWTESFNQVVSKLVVGEHPQQMVLSVTCGIAGVAAGTGGFMTAMRVAERACRDATRANASLKSACIKGGGYATPSVLGLPVVHQSSLS